MRWQERLAWLLSLGALAGCGPAQPDRTAPQAFEGRGFRATLRKDVLHNTITPQPGVTLYDFHVGSKPLLLVYVGDKPGYPRFAWRPEREEELALPSGLHGQCRAAQTEHGRARECLITLGRSSPRALHVSYEALGPDWVEVADGIIASVAPSGS